MILPAELRVPSITRIIIVSGLETETPFTLDASENSSQFELD